MIKNVIHISLALVFMVGVFVSVSHAENEDYILEELVKLSYEMNN